VKDEGRETEEWGLRGGEGERRGRGRWIGEGEGGREEEQVSSKLTRAEKIQRSKRREGSRRNGREERTSIGWFQVAKAPPIVEQAILSKAVSLSSFDRPRTALI